MTYQQDLRSVRKQLRPEFLSKLFPHTDSVPKRAVLAVAHAQLIAIYWALRNATPYPEQVERLQEDRREAQIRHHLQRLTKLGYEPNKIG